MSNALLIGLQGGDLIVPVNKIQIKVTTPAGQIPAPPGTLPILPGFLVITSTSLGSLNVVDESNHPYMTTDAGLVTNFVSGPLAGNPAPAFNPPVLPRPFLPINFTDPKGENITSKNVFILDQLGSRHPMARKGVSGASVEISPPDPQIQLKGSLSLSNYSHSHVFVTN